MSRTIGVGVDLVSLERLELEQERFAERLLTPAERSWCASSPRFVERLAGRLAAKEAVLKALGTGLSQGLSWQQIEILPDALGMPQVSLSGAAAERLASLGGSCLLISIAHDGGMAIAYAQVVAE